MLVKGAPGKCRESQKHRTDNRISEKIILEIKKHLDPKTKKHGIFHYEVDNNPYDRCLQ